MTIPKGYKQTELGIIPEDWEVIKLSECVSIYDGTHQTPNYVPVGIPFYSVENITANNFHDTKYITHEEHCVLNRNRRIEKGDILMTRIGSMGVCKYIDWNINASFYVSLALLKPKEIINAKYLVAFSQGSCFKSEIIQNSLQFAIPQKINLGNIGNVRILLPKQKEQNAIAEALSDVDALIAALDKKIEKKRLIKQGTMQELLTGKKRLKGFTEEWVEVQVQDVFEVTRGYVLSSRNTYPLQTGEYIYPVYSSQTSNKGILGYYNQYLFEDCITWTTDGANAGDVNFRKGKFYCTNVCGVLKNDLGYSNQCVAEILNMVAKSYVSYIGNPKLMNQVMATIAIRIPNTIQEQQSIAAILSDMDKEIAELEARREKYQQLKSGMMQKLLTGQIRLVKPQTQPMSIVPTVEAVSIDAVVTAAHIVNKLHRSKGWGRTKMQKALHLVEYGCQLDFNHQYIRNTAGPDDQQLLKHIDNKFKQYRLVDRRDNKDISGHIIHYDYVPAAMIDDAENAFAAYPLEKRNQIDALLEKIKYLDLAEAEIVSTLYAVWNNRLIKREPINDKLLLEDFYAWSEHKSEYKRTLVEQMLRFMRKNNIVPTGWGKYIDCKI